MKCVIFSFNPEEIENWDTSNLLPAEDSIYFVNLRSFDKNASKLQVFNSAAYLYPAADFFVFTTEASEIDPALIEKMLEPKTYFFQHTSEELWTFALTCSKYFRLGGFDFARKKSQQNTHRELQAFMQLLDAGEQALHKPSLNALMPPQQIHFSQRLGSSCLVF